MSQTKIKKDFDALAFKEQAQQKIYEETKDMNNAELLAYYKSEVKKGPLANFWTDLKKSK